jgi:hypothetical protein
MHLQHHRVGDDRDRRFYLGRNFQLVRQERQRLHLLCDMEMTVHLFLHLRDVVHLQILDDLLADAPQNLVALNLDDCPP